LGEKIDYDQYWKYVADDLTEILQDHLAEGQTKENQAKENRAEEDWTENVPQLAQNCAQNEPDAVDKVNKMLADTRSRPGSNHAGCAGP